MPNGNGTTDGELVAVADSEDRVVVTKDRDSATITCFDTRPDGYSL